MARFSIAVSNCGCLPTIPIVGRIARRWPCSELSGKPLFVEFDRGGLVDLAINGRMGDCPNHELTAIVSDHLRGKLPIGHPCQVYMEQQP